MTSTKKDPVLVVLQLTGGNDYLNTVIPYANPLYRDNRPAVGITEDRVLRLDDQVGLHPEMEPIKRLYDRGDVAIIHGIGYADSPRSHFRSMDIWHTCEPDKLGTEGWLGRASLDIDPNKENVLTTVSFGPSLFRALAMPKTTGDLAPLAQYGGPIDATAAARAIRAQARAARAPSKHIDAYSTHVAERIAPDVLAL